MRSALQFEWDAHRRRRTEEARRLIDRRVESARAGFAGHWHGDREWYDRMPVDAVYQQKREALLRDGLWATVAFWVSSNADYPDGPLVGLEVRPEDPSKMLGSHPSGIGNPYHISVAKYTGAMTPELRAFYLRFARPRRVHLQFQRVSNNAYVELHQTRDPIASDPVVRALHGWDTDYGNRNLHISA